MQYIYCIILDKYFFNLDLQRYHKGFRGKKAVVCHNAPLSFNTALY